MWTAELTKIEKDGANVVPTVVFTNDKTGETITETPRANDITDERMKAWAQARIESLDKRDATGATLTVGPIGAPATSTQAEIDADAFFADLRVLHGLKSAVDMGLLDMTAKIYTDRIAAVKAAFKLAYLSDPRFG